MDNKKNDGGQAFPRESSYQDPLMEAKLKGMSLRDYFAGQALQGMFANPNSVKEVDGKALFHNENFKSAYQAADAMIKERDK